MLRASSEDQPWGHDPSSVGLGILPPPACPAPRSAHFVGHLLAVLFRRVDQRLVQVHHEHQLSVSMQPLLVFPSQLLSLLKLK